MLTNISYGARFRKHRRVMQQFLNPQAVAKLHPLVEGEVKKFALHLLRAPDALEANITTYVASVVVLTTYGRSVESAADPYVTLADQAVKLQMCLGPPGATLIDFFPFRELTAVH